MSQNRVSIIIPAYKAESFLEQALRSIAAQTWQDWEVHLLEDGVFDRTGDILSRFAKTVEQPVNHYALPENRGVSHARNTCLDKAAGAYIAFLDADDMWHPRHLENAITLLRTNSCDWVVSANQSIDSAGNALGHPELLPVAPQEQYPTIFFRDGYAFYPSALVAKAALFAEGARFREELRIAEDLELYVRLIKAGARLGISSSPTCLHRVHGESATADPIKFCEGMARVLALYLGDPVIDQSFCRAAIVDNLFSVVKMAWRQQPRRSLQALRRLLSVQSVHLPSWLLSPLVLLSCLRQAITRAS